MAHCIQLLAMIQLDKSIAFNASTSGNPKVVAQIPYFRKEVR